MQARPGDPLDRSLIDRVAKWRDSGGQAIEASGKRRVT